MKILVTGGNTWIHIDSVRVITNVFRGTTACQIAREAYAGQHDVTLVGNPQMHRDLSRELKEYLKALFDCHPSPECRRGSVRYVDYRTYDELYEAMEREITEDNYDAIVHSAAVSDYRVTKVYSPDIDDEIKDLVTDGKIPSFYRKISIDLEPTEKIIDKIRDPWGFTGKLVKFKLQVGVGDDELRDIARRSRKASRADIIVANCKEWASTRAYVITGDRAYQCRIVLRKDLASTIIDALEDD